MHKKYLFLQRTIDLLKMDIEGGEWGALPQMFQSGVLRKVRQISMETHFDFNMDLNSIWRKVHLLQCLIQLYEAGFRIFMREHNINMIMKFEAPVGQITSKSFTKYA